MPRIRLDHLDVIGGVREEPPGALEALMESIEVHHMLYPLIVVPNPDCEGRYIIKSGRRRYAAMLRLNKIKAMCKIKRDITEAEAEMLEITENFHRLELTTAERDH